MTATNLRIRFGDSYQVVDDGTDDPVRDERVWGQEIQGKNGVIYPYGHNGLLAVRFDSSTRTKTDTWCRRLDAVGFRPIQRGDWEIVFKFHLDQFDFMAGLIQARGRRRLSPENRAKAIAALAKAKKRPRPPDLKGFIRPKFALFGA